MADDIKIKLTVDDKKFKSSLARATALLKRFEVTNKATGVRIANADKAVLTARVNNARKANSILDNMERTASNSRINTRRREAAITDGIAKRQSSLLFGKRGVGGVGGKLTEKMGLGGIGGIGLAGGAALAGFMALRSYGRQYVEFDSTLRKITVSAGLTAEQLMRVKQSVVEAAIASSQSKQDIVGALEEVGDIVDLTTLDYTKFSKLLKVSGLEGKAFGEAFRNIKEQLRLDDTGALSYMEKFVAFLDVRKMKEFASVSDDIFKSMASVGIKGAGAATEVGALMKATSPEAVKSFLGDLAGQKYVRKNKSGTLMEVITNMMMDSRGDFNKLLPAFKDSQQVLAYLNEEYKRTGKSMTGFNEIVKESDKAAEDINKRMEALGEGPKAMLEKINETFFKAFAGVFEGMSPQQIEAITTALTGFAEGLGTVLGSITTTLGKWYAWYYDWASKHGGALIRQVMGIPSMGAEESAGAKAFRESTTWGTPEKYTPPDMPDLKVNVNTVVNSGATTTQVELINEMYGTKKVTIKKEKN
jgi:hypothetical protein